MELLTPLWRGEWHFLAALLSLYSVSGKLHCSCTRFSSSGEFLQFCPGPKKAMSAHEAPFRRLPDTFYVAESSFALGSSPFISMRANSVADFLSTVGRSITAGFEAMPVVR